MATAMDWTAGSLAHRDLDDGRVLVLWEMIFNVRLCIGPQGFGVYDDGWCYAKADRVHALVDLASWDGAGDPPGPWVKRAGE